MLKLKIVNQVPDTAVNISYIKNNPARSTNNVTLLDYSKNIPENNSFLRTTRFSFSTIQSSVGMEFSTIYGFPHTMVSSRALVFSNESLDTPGLKIAKPLFYYHKLGKAEYQDSVYWNITLKDQIDFSKQLPKDVITITNEFGEITEDFYWTIKLSNEFYHSGLTYKDTGEDIYYENKRYILYTDRLPLPGMSYFIHFNAYDEAKQKSLPNYREILTLSPDTVHKNDHNWFKQEGSD